MCNGSPVCGSSRLVAPCPCSWSATAAALLHCLREHDSQTKASHWKMEACSWTSTNMYQFTSLETVSLLPHQAQQHELKLIQSGSPRNATQVSHAVILSWQDPHNHTLTWSQGTGACIFGYLPKKHRVFVEEINDRCQGTRCRILWLLENPPASAIQCFYDSRQILHIGIQLLMSRFCASNITALRRSSSRSTWAGQMFMLGEIKMEWGLYLGGRFAVAVIQLFAQWCDLSCMPFTETGSDCGQIGTTWNWLMFFITDEFNWCHASLISRKILGLPLRGNFGSVLQILHSSCKLQHSLVKVWLNSHWSFGFLSSKCFLMVIRIHIYIYIYMYIL